MAGNALEFVQDCYHYDYVDAPDDGSAWDVDCVSAYIMLRGDSYGGTVAANGLRTTIRFRASDYFWVPGMGVRCVR